MSSRDVTQIQHREVFGSWLMNNGLTGNGAEIGCAFGGYATILLQSWSGFLYMIDPFRKYAEYKESTNETAPFDQWYEGCKALEQTGRVQVLREFSVAGAKQIEDDCLDFAFIDGNHGYTAVLEDLDAWYPKIHSGGVLCGHDYGNQTEAMGCAGWDCEVQRAVEDWLKGHPELKQPHLTPCSSFWILKP